MIMKFKARYNKSWKVVAITISVVVFTITCMRVVSIYKESVFRQEVEFAFSAANLRVEYRDAGTTESLRCAPSEIAALHEWLLTTKRVDALVSWPLPTTDVFVFAVDGELKAQFQINDGPNEHSYSMLRWNGKLRAGRRFRFQRTGAR